MSSTEATSKYGRSVPTKADVPAAPAANRNGRSGKQQLDAAITLPSAARLANTVLAEPDLLFCCFSSTCGISFSVRTIHSAKPFEQGTTVLVLDFPFQAQVAITISESPCKVRFQPRETFDLFPDIPQLALEHGLDFGTSVM